MINKLDPLTHRYRAEETSRAIVGVGEARDSPHGNCHTSLLRGEGLKGGLGDINREGDARWGEGGLIVCVSCAISCHPPRSK